MPRGSSSSSPGRRVEPTALVRLSPQRAARTAAVGLVWQRNRGLCFQVEILVARRSPHALVSALNARWREDDLPKLDVADSKSAGINHQVALPHTVETIPIFIAEPRPVRFEVLKPREQSFLVVCPEVVPVLDESNGTVRMRPLPTSNANSGRLSWDKLLYAHP